MSLLPKRITEAREALGLTKAGLAKKAGITPAAITQFESGDREPTIDTLKKLAKALQVELNYLIGKDFEPIEAQVLFRNLKDLSDKDKEILMQVYNRLKDS